MIQFDFHELQFWEYFSSNQLPVFKSCLPRLVPLPEKHKEEKKENKEKKDVISAGPEVIVTYPSQIIRLIQKAK